VQGGTLRQARGERGSGRSLTMRFWISLVPSEMVVSRASRPCRRTPHGTPGQE
jgi:hypothetical protein